MQNFRSSSIFNAGREQGWEEGKRERKERGEGGKEDRDVVGAVGEGRERNGSYWKGSREIASSCINDDILAGYSILFCLITANVHLYGVSKFLPDQCGHKI